MQLPFFVYINQVKEVLKMLNVIQKTIDLGDGRSITIETGKLAKQADGSVVVRMGDTMLLATVVSATEAGGGRSAIGYRSGDSFGTEASRSRSPVMH